MAYVSERYDLVSMIVPHTHPHPPTHTHTPTRTHTHTHACTDIEKAVQVLSEEAPCVPDASPTTGSFLRSPSDLVGACGGPAFLQRLLLGISFPRRVVVFVQTSAYSSATFPVHTHTHTHTYGHNAYLLSC